VTASQPRQPSLQRRRVIALGLVPAVLITVLLVAAYYLAPLDRLHDYPLGVSFTVGVCLLVALTVYEVLAITRARFPAARAIRALATITPSFLILFAAIYYVLANDNPANFSQASLTRSDTLYFTVTTFSTVGFGDITATSETARLLVTAQMALDLLFLGLGIRAFMGALRIGRERQAADDEAATPPAAEPRTPQA
jgi:voltage-gated potassium channel